MTALGIDSYNPQSMSEKGTREWEEERKGNVIKDRAVSGQGEKDIRTKRAQGMGHQSRRRVKEKDRAEQSRRTVKKRDITAKEE